MDWYCRKFPAGPKALEGLKRLRSFRTIVVDENTEFYRVRLDPNTTEIVIFIKPGNYKLAMSFRAEICLAPKFGQRLRDVSVEVSPKWL